MPAVGRSSLLLKTACGRARVASCRSFHSSRSPRASILFALSSLSNSRETQHFNKLSRLDRIEHSPPLKLIKSSEIDPFAPSTLPRRPSEPTIHRDNYTRHATRIWDERALRAGRAVLADGAAHVRRLQKALRRAQLREARHAAVALRDRSAWAAEAGRLRNEVRSAGLLIVLSIGTATALATWRFWPSSDAEQQTLALGDRLAARTKSVLSLPDSTTTPLAVGPVETTVSTVPLGTIDPKAISTAPLDTSNQITSRSWWRGLIWKQ